MLKIENINVFYGLVQALWDISIEVPEGSIVSIVGANGAGKTTLMRTINGIIKPKSGKIIYNGIDITGKDSNYVVSNGITHVPEGRQIFPKMSVYENLEIGAMFIKDAWEKRKETMEFVFSLFPRLKERINQAAGTMSGGEQQMLAVARALMGRPKLMLVDEPSLGLSPALTLTVFDALKKANKEGVTILLVEQNVKKSLEMAKIGYVLENGRIVMKDDGKTLLANPHIKKAYLGV
ncbi:MAG TPA: ABC transporter ATP-binding protein [Spirochaetota bacterium]|nr:ABC transporter ATP-binding protein [Spirochaetota bacterium]HOM38497.1 ABC transporter ATP-binding protein [Spirochaetota bacterium]HPQ49037.1 ABC transporter ATP-binding protein [Spirochaetota bacterium]